MEISLIGRSMAALYESYFTLGERPFAAAQAVRKRRLKHSDMAGKRL
jgi:hypothetical protein